MAIALAVAVVSLAIMSLGAVVLVQTLRGAQRRTRCLPASATVLSLRHETSNSTGDGAKVALCFPTVAFADANEQVHRAEVRQAVSWQRPAVGDQIEVLYDPDDPTVVLPASAGATIVFGCLGLGFFLAGLLSLVTVGVVLWIVHALDGSI